MFINSRSFRANVLNLSIVAAFMFIAFGCFCGGDNTRRRGGIDVAPTNSTTASNRKGGSTKPSTKADTAKKSREPDNGDFVVEYVDVQNPAYEKANAQLREQKVMENAARDLNKALSLPHDITLITKDCGQINAFYKESDRSITICYEIMDYYYALYKKGGASEDDASRKMFDAMQFIFLHEVGHALIDAYQLPVPGDEEDAADRLSSYINLEELGETGSRAAIAAAEGFDLQSKLAGNSNLPFYDEHSLDQQRFYNILCSLYGSNPSKYQVLVTKGSLPEQRAVRCPSEYKQIVTSWQKLLEPYRKQ